MSLLDSTESICSPASELGTTRSISPDGGDWKCGPEVLHANLSAKQAKDLGLLMTGTCGQPSTGSSKSVALQLSLESRLQNSLSSHGSTLYKLTWKEWVTALGQSRFRLRASAVRKTGSEFIGWPTPTTPSGGQKNPLGTSQTGRRPNGTKATVTLGNVYMDRIGKPLPPAFALMLMGIKPAWLDCAPLATRSTRSKRLNSSEPQSKQSSPKGPK